MPPKPAKLEPWTPEETRRRLERLFGPDKTADKTAEALSLGAAGRVTVFRWLRGESAIPGPARTALEMMERCPRDRLPARLRALLAERG